MIHNKVKKKLLEGKISFGSWIQIGQDNTASDILAQAGFDWLGADSEHTVMGMKEISSFVRSCIQKGAVPLVRVKDNGTLTIRQVLDTGALGVIVPLVNTKEDALQAVRAAKYPPAGVRGYAWVQANDYGINFYEYAHSANDDILVIAMIESKEAVENIDEILSVDGIDGVFIGPYDMSGSYGIPGQVDAPCMKKAFEKVAKSCIKHGKFSGQHIVVPTQENVKDAVRQGYTFIALGMDTYFLIDGSRRALVLVEEEMGNGR